MDGLMDEKNFNELMNEIEECANIIAKIKIDLWKQEKSSIYKKLTALQDKNRSIQFGLIEIQYKDTYKNANEE